VLTERPPRVGVRRVRYCVLEKSMRKAGKVRFPLDVSWVFRIVSAWILIFG
jgi:hypothetical protein